MRYLVLLAGDEVVWRTLSHDQQEAYLRAHDAFGAAVEECGTLVAGEALGEAATATTLRRHEGKLAVTDGPYAETVERIGGVYLLDVGDLDQLIELCELLPPIHTVEIRPTVPAG